ncbi:hypothetical protein JNUCC1_02814 [Lentibacillus sp. JNUCC-1]|uniref:hypothetical protein n=1 Tax=Lentibacillus sp. JNUCC-1 TaxID=2654513 RepID=UPI0012E70B4B|nr:hypothetical protein [Lentibacillus sp. JNUCC-1]MUV38942.1 hypothetical protein [Lentibacillus sp. JNUCC-1]
MRGCSIIFFSRWTLFQGLIVALLIGFAFIAEMFKEDIGIPFSSTDPVPTPVLTTSMFLIVTIGLISLLMIFQVKKSDTFLKHRLWDKMYIIMPVIIGISLILLIILFVTEPFSTVIQNNRWMIYVLGYYILFLINAAVVAMIHKAKKNTISNESKIAYSFAWTSLGLIAVIFIL